jgi:hypothetical protein
MNWTQLLKSEAESAYATTLGLLDRINPDSLNWKPESGTNWMTMGQLLMHISGAFGASCKGFVRGDWGLPEGVKMEDLPPEEMLPLAEKMPQIAKVQEAKRLLMQDKVLAFEMIGLAGEEALANRVTSAPWAPDGKFVLGRHLLQMIQHLNIHKAQLFYYLKLQGKNVNTLDLWG